MRTALNLVRLFAVLSQPIIPEASGRVLDALGASPDERHWPTDVRSELRMLLPHRAVQEIGLLFRRITDDETALWASRFAGTASSGKLSST